MLEAPPPALIDSERFSDSSMMKSRSSFWLLSYFTPANRVGFLGGSELPGPFVSLIRVATAF